MAQKPVLRGEVGARVLRVRSVSREEVWASAGVQTQDVAEDVLGAAEGGFSSVSGGTHATLALR